MGKKINHSPNDCVLLAMFSGEMTKTEIRKLDLTSLRDFKPTAQGYSISLFAPGEQGTADPGSVANFFAALDAAAGRNNTN